MHFHIEFFFFLLANTHARTHTQVHTRPAVLRSYQRDNKLIENHLHVLEILQSPTSLSHLLCPAEKTLNRREKFDVLGNWGHSNWQERR